MDGTTQVEKHRQALDPSAPPKLSNARMSKKAKPRAPAPEGVVVTDRSCARCRIRKVRCNRVFPRCNHCTARAESCDLVDWKPKPKLKPTDPIRVAALEKRLAELEEQLAHSGGAQPTNESSVAGASTSQAMDFDLSAAFDLPSDFSSFDPLSTFSAAAAPAAPTAPFASLTALPDGFTISADPTYNFDDLLLPAPPASAPSQPPTHSAAPAAPVLQSLATSPTSSADSAALVSSIGATSLDWRLAMPQLATSLSRHLTEAFTESCCFLLEPYNFFRSGATMNELLRLPDEGLTPAQKVSLAAFCAVGARTSPHSAVLGISIHPSDTIAHPKAPLLSAGTRRQNACKALIEQAGRLNYEAGTMEHATAENLAALMTMLQLAMFTELEPSKSRPYLQSAVSHYKDLLDAAETEEEQEWLKKTFGFALYTADCLVSALSRRRCFILDSDLATYFSHDATKVVVPRLPNDNLLNIAQKIMHGGMLPLEAALKSCKHLLACWTCACQRAFAQLAAPPKKSAEQVVEAVRKLWMSIDSTRAATQFLLSSCPPRLNTFHIHGHPHTHSHSSDSSSSHHHSVHEDDYGAQLIRLDRDLLDLVNLAHRFLATSGPGGTAIVGVPEEVLRESLGRVRKGLRTRAAYLKTYVSGVDMHMVYHEIFSLEHLPNWTQLALDRCGQPGGPASEEEELTEMEMRWLIEGLQHACYYHPLAEKRLLELDPSADPAGGETSAAGAAMAGAGVPGPPQGAFAWGGDPLLPTPSPPAAPNLTLPLAPAPNATTPTPPAAAFSLSPLFGPSPSPPSTSTATATASAAVAPVGGAGASFLSPLQFGESALPDLGLGEDGLDGAFGWGGT
ncbi:hypothetical protein JCM8097_002455 [Rhodosporidiobolus ruineniae]